MKGITDILPPRDDDMKTKFYKGQVLKNKISRGIELEEDRKAKEPSGKWRDMEEGRPRAGQWVLLMDVNFRHVAMGERQKDTDIYWIAKGRPFINPAYYMTKDDLLNLPTK